MTCMRTGRGLIIDIVIVCLCADKSKYLFDIKKKKDVAHEVRHRKCDLEITIHIHQLHLSIF